MGVLQNRRKPLVTAFRKGDVTTPRHVNRPRAPINPPPTGSPPGAAPLCSAAAQRMRAPPFVPHGHPQALPPRWQPERAGEELVTFSQLRDTANKLLHDEAVAPRSAFGLTILRRRARSQISSC